MAFFLVLGLSVACLAPRPARATTFFPQPFPEKVSEAPVIVRGKIGMSYANWAMGPDGTRRIYTFYEVAVDEALKGHAGSGGPTIVIRELGGEKDGVGMRIAGTAQFDRNEDVVIMLGEQNQDGSHDVWGMMMGKYDIERGDDGKEYLKGAGVNEVLRPELRGHEDLMGHREGQHGPDSESKWSIDALRQLIRDQEQEKYKNGPAGKTVGNQAVRPAESKIPEAEATAAAKAPQLQNQDKGMFGAWLWVLMGGAAVVVAVIMGIFRKRK
jgi:hypothetical protein